jgi:hypothetical protein
MTRATSNVIRFAGRTKEAAVDIVRRDEAIESVRTLWRQVQLTKGISCRRMLDLGDVLARVREAAGYCGWGAFLKACKLPERDAQIALQLSKGRPQIEAENAKRASGSEPPLSIRAALKLIRPKKEPKSQGGGEASQKSTAAITIDAVIAWLKTATAEDRCRVTRALELLKTSGVSGTPTAA